MTKLEQLIAKLCPDGVEHKSLDHVCVIETGAQLNKDKLLEIGLYPVMNGGISPSGYWNEYNTEANNITISQGGASAGYVNFVTTRFWSGAHCYTVKLTSDKILYKYLYYFIKNNQDLLMNSKQGAGIPGLNRKSIYLLVIPIPPLLVQHEIVRILDNFSKLNEDIIAELADELTMRRKQYEYYRKQLILNTTCNTAKLKDIVEIYLGLTYTPTYVANGVTFISSQNISRDYLDLSNVKYISEEEYNKATSNAKPKRGDILFTRVGSNLGHPVIVDTDEQLCIFVSLGYLRVKNNRVINSYIKHWMNTDLFWEQVRKKVHGAAKMNLNTGWIKEFDIILPSQEEQERIVGILDRYDTLYNTLINDLSAEIEARQKQYEFYRDKLLTFKETTA